MTRSLEIKIQLTLHSSTKMAKVSVALSVMMTVIISVMDLYRFIAVQTLARIVKVMALSAKEATILTKMSRKIILT